MPFFRLRKPTAKDNYDKNPTLGGTSGYSCTGGTAVRSDTRAHSGTHSLLVTPAGASCVLHKTLATLPNDNMTVSVWASGGEPTLVQIGAASVQPWRVQTVGVWSRYSATFTAAQANGQTQADWTCTRATYLDDFQVEPGTTLTTELNGDMGQGYGWRGEHHNSASYRRRYVGQRLIASGGIEYQLDDDDRVRLSLAHGIGVAPVNLRSQGREYGDGEIHLDKNLGPQVIRLTLWLVEEDFDALSDLRTELINLIAPKDEIMLLTDMGGVEQSIIASYTGGLELGEIIVGNEKLTLNLVAATPGWNAVGQQVVTLTYTKTITSTYSAVKRDGEWLTMGSVGATIRRLVRTNDGAVYACCQSDGTYGWLAQWTGEAWTALARVSGNSKQVWDVARSFDGTKLYLVGSYTTVTKPDGTGSVAASNIAAYTVASATFAALGAGTNGLIEKVEWDPTGAVLYLVGAFTTAGGVACNRVAKLTISGTAYAALGAGLDAAGHALVVRRDNKVIVGGEFDAAGATGTAVVGLAVGNAGSGSLTGLVRGYCVTAYNVSGVEVARSKIVWATSSNPGDSISWTAHASAAGGYGIYILTSLGWSFVTAVAADVVATQNLTSNGDENPRVPTSIASLGTIATPRIAMWDEDTDTWTTFGQMGFNDTVWDLWLDEDQLTVLAAGAFTIADGNDTIGRLAWSRGPDVVWRGFGETGANGTMYCIRRMADGTIWAVGAATSIGGDSLAAYIGRWIGTPHSGSWVHTDLVPTGTVYAVCECGEDVIVGHGISGSLTAGYANSVDWTGNLEAYPDIIVRGPGVLHTLEVLEAGGALYGDGYTLADGELVTITTKPDGKDMRSSVNGPLVHRKRPGSPFADILALPGETTWTLLITGTGANTDAKLVGHPRYYSPDKV